MDNIMVVINDTECIKILIEKSIKLSPKRLVIVTFSPSLEKEITATLTALNMTDIKVEIVNATSESSKAKAEKIIEIAAKNNTDMIAIYRHNRTSKTQDYSFEKQLLKELQKTSLLICGNRRWKKTMNVMGTLDVSCKSTAQIQLNSQVFNDSVRIAESLKSKLHLMTVIGISRVSKELDIVEPSELLTSKGKVVKAKLEEYISSKKAETKCSTHVTAGVPYEEIPKYAKNHKIDLVMLGNVGRTGLKGLIVGNTAEKILQRLSVDALIVKSTFK